MHPRAEKDLQYKEDLKQKWKPDSRETMHWNRKNPMPVSLKTNLYEHVQQQLSDGTSTVSDFSLDDIMEKSYIFWERFPSENARVHSLITVCMLCLNMFFFIFMAIGDNWLYFIVYPFFFSERSESRQC